MSRQIISNAKIVTPTQVIEGSLVIENGRIAEVLPDKKIEGAFDAEGKWLIPGCIDIHSDYLEKELRPRPSASFPVPFAMHFMDLRAASCGITTLFSAISFSDDANKGRDFDQSIDIAAEIAKGNDQYLVRHYIHARLDPNTDAVHDYLKKMRDLENLYIVVYNENIPGQRQFPLEMLIEKKKASGKPEEEIRSELEAKIAEMSKINNRAAIQAGLSNCILGSHDDTRVEHVDEALHFGATLSEMPTTMEAAKRAKELGMWVCMGAPNYYRGSSHCGNLSCEDAIEAGVVDMLCSDYHFPALIASLVKLFNKGMNPSEAVNMVSLNPAKMLKLDHEIGSIEEGKRADLVLFDLTDNGYASVEKVWVDGNLKFETSHQVPNASFQSMLTAEVVNG